MTRPVLLVSILAAAALAGCVASPNVPRDDANRRSAAARGADAPACSPARAARVANSVHHFRFDGHDRTYLLSVPVRRDGVRPGPLILDLHGWGGDLRTFDAETMLAKEGSALGDVVVTPQALGNPTRWNWDGRAGGPDDFGFVRALLADLEQRLCIDTNRVYAAGHSNGAAFAGLLACRAPYEFAAVASVSATVPSSCPPGIAPSMLTVRGTADPSVPYDQSTIDNVVGTWAENDDCSEHPRGEEPISGVRRVRYDGCAHGAAVVVDTVVGGVHVWPGSPTAATKAGNSTAGQTFPATREVLDFFARHRRTWGSPGVTGGARPCTNSTVTAAERTIPMPEQTLDDGWAPDSKHIAYADRTLDSPVMILDVRRGVTRAITPAMHAVAPTWSSNGRIYFSTRPDGGGEGRAQNLSHHTPPDLYVVDADGSYLRPIALTGPHPEGPTTVYWDSSPDNLRTPTCTRWILPTVRSRGTRAVSRGRKRWISRRMVTSR